MKLTARDFLGNWSIFRTIEDFRAGQTGTLVGTASFKLEDGGVNYWESGDFSYAGQVPLRAERGYLWTFLDQSVEVRHADGSAFHSFVPTETSEATPHLCGDDMYQGQYRFAAFPEWEVQWDVEGPRKCYRSVTQYKPL